MNENQNHFWCIDHCEHGRIAVLPRMVPLLYLPDNDTLLHINKSVKPENHESRLCVCVSFTCLHVCTFISVDKYLLKHVKDI